MPPVRLSEEAVRYLINYRWSGNIRQLRNVAEQISVLETNRDISAHTLQSYIPNDGGALPSVINTTKKESDFSNEREILYKVLFDMKADLNDLKKLTLELMQNGNAKVQENNKNLIQRIYGQNDESVIFDEPKTEVLPSSTVHHTETFQDSDIDDDGDYLIAEAVEEHEPLSLEAKEVEMIKKALDRNKGKRKAAADELGISERTLYRKIKQYDL